MRIKVTVEYFGKKYFGMQKQINLPTIQSEIELALSEYAQKNIDIDYCGRTDTGVHAFGQVIHFDLENRDPSTVTPGLNFYLKNKDIVIISSEPTRFDFHSRFDAKMRHYRYKIINRESPLTFFNDTHLHVKKTIDIKKMSEAANLLVGYRDFSSFRSSGCSSSTPFKTISDISINTIYHGKTGTEVIIDISARSFLYHMVRNIVGSLLYVGCGKGTLDWLKKSIELKERSIMPAMVPAHGLYFYGVDY